MKSWKSAMESEPVALLRARNPVPPARKDEVARQLAAGEGLDGILRLIRESRSRPKVQPRNRTRLAIAVAAASSLLLVGTALGFGASLVSFFDAPVPDQQIRKVVFSLAKGAPAGMDSGLIPENARLVGMLGQDRIWAAPTTAGGMCYGIGGQGGCDRLGTVPLDASVSYSGDRQSVRAVTGFVNTRYAHGLELSFRDGHTERPLLLKVSPPIDVGFFAYRVPAERQNATQTLVAVRATDAEGRVVSTREIPLSQLPQPDPIADALVDERTATARIPTRDGDATLWTAPTRYQGKCVWAEFGGKFHFVTACQPSGYTFDRFAIQAVTTSRNVVIAGTVDKQFDAVTVRFADGAKVTLRPENGFILYEVPERHLQPTTRIAAIDAVAPNGDVVTSVPGGSVGSCWAALPTDISPRPTSCVNGAELRGS